MAEGRPVSFSTSEWSTYARLARRLGVSNAELVRHAVEVYALLRREIKSGAEVLIVYPSGSIDQVIGV